MRGVWGAASPPSGGARAAPAAWPTPACGRPRTPEEHHRAAARRTGKPPSGGAGAAPAAWPTYHANTSTSQGCDSSRSTRAQKITWNSDGTPNFGTPVALGTAVTLPAGDPGTVVSSYKLVNRNSGKVLDVENCSTADGANVRQWAWLNNTCQQWRLQP